MATATKKPVALKYDSDSIKSLAFPENIRQKPTLYIGPIDESGVFTILREVADNVVDEALANRATRCDIFIHPEPDASVKGFYVLDNGEGIPVKPMTIENPIDGTKVKVPAIQAILTMTHTSGKFDDKAYAAARGCFVGDTILQVLHNYTPEGVGYPGGSTVSWSMGRLYEEWLNNPLPFNIQTWDPATDHPAVCSVSHVQLTKYTEELTDVCINGEVVRSTPDHPYYVRTITGIVKVRADRLEVGTRLIGVNTHNQRVVESVTNIKLTDPVPVYDITVDDAHAFFVAPGVLVSNTHGLGIKASNALSRVYHVWTFRDTKWWEISFAYGRPKQVLCNCPAPKHPVSGAPLKKGTLVYLEPDPKIFECIGARGLSKVFSLKSPTTTMLLEWCRIASYFTPGLTLRVGHNTGIVKEFVSQDGPKDFIARKLDQLNRERSAEDGEKAEPIGLIEEGAEFVSQDALYDCVVAFTNSENANLDAFTNGLRNAEGGLHLTAFLNALQGAITPFAAKGSNFTQRELREGLVALVNVKLSAPQFDSQTKEKLVDQRAGKPVFESLFAAFQAFFAERPLLAKRICERATSLHSLRTKFLASKKVVSKLRDVAKKGLPVKGQVSPDCTAEQRELYIVEGDSAAGSVRNARDPFYQEALPIRGKVTNAAKDPKNKAIESDEIINILAQMGFDPKAENPLEKLRVSKIICLADPDPDGPLTGDSTVPVRFQGTWTVETMEDLASDRWAGVEYDVLAWNGKSFCITEAEDCRVTEIVNKLVVITLANGEKIRCAEGHELAIITNRPVLRDVLPSNVGLYMVPASKLKAGDVLASVEDGVVKHQWHNLSGRQYLGGIRVEKVKTQAAEGTPVYCLTVPGYHNFVLSSGVLSKNCHINSLLLTLLYKFLPGLFAKGMVYVAEVPEFYAIPKKHSPLFDTKPAALQAQLDKAGLKAEICHIKGYGEIDSDILKTLAFDPATRNVIKIVPTESMNGEVEFMKLMGGGSESRKLLLGI